MEIQEPNPQEKLPVFVKEFLDMIKEQFVELNYFFDNSIPVNTIQEEEIGKVTEELVVAGTIVIGEYFVPGKDFKNHLKKVLSKKNKKYKKIFTKNMYVDEDIQIKQLIVSRDGSFFNMIVCPGGHVDYIGKNLSNLVFAGKKPIPGYVLGVGS